MFRTVLLTLTLFTVFAADDTAAATSVDCRAIADPMERLACYDAVVDETAGPAPEAAAAPVQSSIAEQPASAKPVPAPKPAVQETITVPTPPPTTSPSEPTPTVASTPATPKTASAPDAEIDPETMFGRDKTSITDMIGEMFKFEKIDAITAPVAEIQKSPLGRLVVVLDNGQIWMQTDTNKLSLKPGDEVKIREGLGNSYLLNKASGSRSLKVRRID